MPSSNQSYSRGLCWIFEYLYEVYAVWYHEFKLFSANKYRILFSMLQAAVTIAIVGFGLNSFINLPIKSISYTQYFGVGFLVILSISGATAVGQSMAKGSNGFIKNLISSPLRRSAIILGKIFGQLTTEMFAQFPLLLFLMVYSKNMSIISVILSLSVMIMLSIGFFSLGIIIMNIIKQAGFFNRTANVLTYGIMFFSNAFYPTTKMPYYLKTIIMINPLTYGCDALRYFINSYHELPLLLDFAVLVIFMLLSLLLSSIIFEKTQG